jgi:hypothetical protein
VRRKHHSDILTAHSDQPATVFMCYYYKTLDLHWILMLYLNLIITYGSYPTVHQFVRTPRLVSKITFVNLTVLAEFVGNIHFLLFLLYCRLTVHCTLEVLHKETVPRR